MLRVVAVRVADGWELQVRRSVQGVVLVGVLLVPLVLGTMFTVGSLWVQLQGSGSAEVVMQLPGWLVALAIQPAMAGAILWFFLRQPVGTVRLGGSALSIDVSRLEAAVSLEAIEEVEQGPGYLVVHDGEQPLRVTDGWPGNARRWLRDALREGRVPETPP